MKLYRRHHTQCGNMYLNFSITQILREINFVDSRIAKPTILAHLKALNFKNRAPKIAQMAISELSDSPKLVSRKI